MRSLIRKMASLVRLGWLWFVLILAGAGLLYLTLNVVAAQPLTVIAAVVVFVGLVVLFVAAQRSESPSEARAIQTTLLTPKVVVNEVRAAALVTYSQIGTVSIHKARDTAHPGSPFKVIHDRLLGEELVMDVGVRVIAGVNLMHLREEDVRVQGRSVSITLPPTKVLMVYVDESLTRVLAHRVGWLTAKDISLLDSARREAMEALVNAAIENDLLHKAGQQAAASVAALVRGLGFEQVEVHPTLPPMGAHFEELQSSEALAKLKATALQPLLLDHDS
ncbi:MAG: DUF4230 domain-containing protein [Thermoflexales bacterium]|nr:DUF4230 domain-containing protein [Thermoflexales bacterium]